MNAYHVGYTTDKNGTVYFVYEATDDISSPLVISTHESFESAMLARDIYGAKEKEDPDR